MGQSIFSWLYVVCTALSMLAIANSYFSPFLSLFITTFFAALFFHALNINKLRLIYYECAKQKQSLFLLCCNVLLMWIVTFYGTRELGSLSFIFIAFLVSAIISYVVLQIQGPVRMPGDYFLII